MIATIPVLLPVLSQKCLFLPFSKLSAHPVFFYASTSTDALLYHCCYSHLIGNNPFFLVRMTHFLSQGGDGGTRKTTSSDADQS